MKKKLALIGGGTSNLFLASYIEPSLFDVCIYERKASLGRKFLVAGDGGFNLSHSENLRDLKSKYEPVNFLDEALDSFTNEDMREFLNEIEVPTFIGSSGRIFPNKGIKPIFVLNQLKKKLEEKGIAFAFDKTLTSWPNQNELMFNKVESVQADVIVFSLGGGSWKITGSDGSFLSIFSDKEINTNAFQSANCAFEVNWLDQFIKKHKGKALKNCILSMNDKKQKGEVVITSFGLEGNAIYGLSSTIQNQLNLKEKAIITIDFKPSLTESQLIEKIRASNKNLSQTLREVIKLSKTQVDLIKLSLNKEEFLNLEKLVRAIKQFPIELLSAAPLDEAISTLGGIDLNEVDSKFELKKFKNHYCIGEMLNWNAPTGGYLIQACASQGVFLARHLNEKEAEIKN